MKRFAMQGPVSGELLSYGGLVLVHDDRAELEFLFPGIKVVQIGSQILPKDTMSIKQHPELQGRITWPLRREDFR
jgi:hypothetical protein